MTSSITGPRAARGKLVLWLIISLAASVSVLAATFGTVLYKEQGSIRGQRIVAEESRVSLASDAIAGELRTVRSHVRYLAGSQLAARLLDAADERARADIEQDWIQFARSVDLYDQLRLLDSRGREVLRIKHPVGEEPAAVARGELEDKSDRNYFRNAVGLAAGALYVSPFDLDVEGNRVAKPFKPMLRFATPVSRGGRALGVLVLHFRGQRLIDAARASIDSKSAQLMLLNSKGYWLAAPNPQDEWGFMFGDDRTLALRNPELWKAIGRGSDGRFTDADGVYLYRTIYPLADAEKSAAGSAAGVLSREQSWKLVSWIPTATFEERYSALRRDLTWLFVAALVLVLPLAGYAAIVRGRQRTVHRDLRLAGRVVEATRDAVLVIDRKFRIIRTNPAFTKLTGWEFSDVAGREPETLLSPSRIPQETGAPWRTHLENGWEGMLWFRRAGGADFPVWASISQFSDKANAMRNCILVLTDMTERVREEERVRTLSERDELTALPNRRLLTDRLQQAVIRAQRADTQLAVLFIDLDGFKRVNGEGGHDAGDAVLKATAHRLTAAIRATDTAARLGGDEFVVMLDGPADRTAARAVASKLAAAIEAPIEFAGRTYSVAARVGIKLFPEDGRSASALLRAADREMYTAKVRRQPAPARAAA